MNPASALFRKLFALFASALFAFFAGDADALMMGEKARFAPKANLEIALRLYARGASHAKVWRQTGWHCPARKRGGCRWELPGKCRGREMMNLVALAHTAFAGDAPLRRVLNAACVWQQYPQARDRVRVFRGECGGHYGWASHDGRVCVNLDRVRREGENGERAAHQVLLHELQHQIQFIEKWPAPRNDCPYRQRAMEAEAFEVMARAEWSDAKRKENPPRWSEAPRCY